MQVKQRASLSDAIALHKKGDIPAAIRAYKAVLPETPDDPGLLGVIGTLLLGQGDTQEAETLLKKALAAGGEPKVRLRNLYSYFDLLGRGNRLHEARPPDGQQIPDWLDIPDWPAGGPPAPAERNMLLVVAGTLLLLGRAGQGARLLDQAYPNPRSDAAVLGLSGRLRMALDNAEGAVPLLQRAVELTPDDPRPLIALGAAQTQLGRRKDSQNTALTFIRRFPYHGEPRRTGQKATILILNPPPLGIPGAGAQARGLHFRVNFPSQLPDRLGDRYRFLSVFGTMSPAARPWAADVPSVVLNNLVNEEVVCSPEVVGRLRALLDHIDLPVINPPEKVALVSREQNAERLADIPGLKVPRIMRCRVAEDGVEVAVTEIGEAVGYPAILRPVATPLGSESVHGARVSAARMAADAREAHAVLAETGWRDIFAAAFTDQRTPEGWYRKLRAVFMGDEIIVSSGDCFGSWLVPGQGRQRHRIEFYRENPAALGSLRAILENPEGELGSACLETLERVRAGLGLDILGVDFDVDDAGQVVLFKATPSLVFSHPTQGVPEELWMPEEPLERIHAAFGKLVERRM